MTWPLEKADDVFTALLNPFSPVDVVTLLYFYTQRKNLTKKSPVIMPIVTEDFNIEKYAHVDALLANFQGVFLNQVTSVSSSAQFFLLTTAESVLFASLSCLPLQFSTSLLRLSSITWGAHSCNVPFFLLLVFKWGWRVQAHYGETANRRSLQGAITSSSHPQA